MKLPDYVGPLAYGLKMGVILPGMDIVKMIFDHLITCYRDGLLGDNDVVCITESIVARAQNNYITIDDIAREIKDKMRLSDQDRIAVVFPIASRNRFSMILKGIARAVPSGEVVVQMSYPSDEVGNKIVDEDFIEGLGKDLITFEDLGNREFKHPLTGVDYIKLYHDIIREEGVKPKIFLSNDPLHVLKFSPDGIIAADIHTRQTTKKVLSSRFENCITLDQVCTEGEAYSEWGLLGSNMSSGERLKLAPRDGKEVVNLLRDKVKEELGIDIQVMIYGDGAYLDPSSRIYELADPQAAFAATDGLNCIREGVKYKYLADQCFHEKKLNAEEIEAFIADSSQVSFSEDSIDREGTTPRRMEDVLASLADLVSGSADAGTPVVVVKGFLG